MVKKEILKALEGKRKKFEEDYCTEMRYGDKVSRKVAHARYETVQEIIALVASMSE